MLRHMTLSPSAIISSIIKCKSGILVHRKHHFFVTIDASRFSTWSIVIVKVRRHVHVYHGGVPLIDKIPEVVSNEHLHLVQGQRRCHGCATKISETAKVMSIRPEFIIVFVPALGINLPSFPSARCDEYRFANIFPTFGLV